MPRPDASPDGDQLPGWALDRARSDLFDIDNDEAVLVRARELVHEAQRLDDERHDEYDDPDSGGEG